MNTKGASVADSLLHEARACLNRAHVPYSDFPVAAAVVDDLGRIFTGVNVENASYGLTICAERVAIFTAIAAGAKQITAVAITAKKTKPIAPCGACRQVMMEFCLPETPIYSDNAPEGAVMWTMEELLPASFTSFDLVRSTNLPFNKDAKSAPRESDRVAVVKAAIAKANAAYDSMSKAAKRAGEIAEANAVVRTSRPIKAASSGARASTKKRA